MVARPVEHYEDPLDPQRILREMPGQERANFPAAYREALDGARDPAALERDGDRHEPPARLSQGTHLNETSTVRSCV
jgi:hypothetical protein